MAEDKSKKEKQKPIPKFSTFVDEIIEEIRKEMA